jgi:hypothetical protein
MAVAELRRVHPRALCFVAGLDGATDVSGFPLLGTANEPIPGLVYAVHLYPRRAAAPAALRALARRHPVFVSEWGGQDVDLAWGERTAMLLRAEGIGWTAAHWSGETRLAFRRGQELRPSLFGGVVRRALAIAGEPPARPRIVAASVLNR